MSEMSKEFIKKKEIFNENKNSFSHNIPNVLSRISFEFENDIVWSQLLNVESRQLHSCTTCQT